MARRPSSRAVYQLHWSVYRSWCHEQGHSVSRPSLAKMADFLCWLRSAKGLSVSSIRGYRSVLSVVFRFHLPSLSSDLVLSDLFCSFSLSSAERVLRPPAWDLARVLRFLNSSSSSLYPRLLFALCRRRRSFCWPSPRPNELVSCRIFRPLSPLWVWMPASLIHRILSPSRCRSHVPSLAPSWLSPCPTLQLVLMTTSFCAP